MSAGLAEMELPWWARPPLGAALGGAAGLAATAIAREASPAALFYSVVPIVAAANLAVADLGRRRFSFAETFAVAIGSLLMVGCLQAVGAALLTMALGGLVGARLAGPGRFRDIRQTVLGIFGALACPLATIGAYRLVQGTKGAEPLATGLVAFHLLFWLPTAGAEAALAWSAARARGPQSVDNDFPCSDETSV